MPHPVQRRSLFGTLGALALTRPELAQAAPATTPADARLRELADRHFLHHLDLNPLLGSELLGSPRYEGRLAIDISPRHRQRMRHLAESLQTALRPFESARLGAQGRLNLALLQRQAQTQLEALQFPEHLLALNQYGGLPVRLGELAGGQGVQRLATLAHYQGFLRRLGQLPAWVDQVLRNLQQGVRLGVVQHRELIERSLQTLRELARAPAAEHPYLAPVRAFPAGLSTAQQAALTRAYAGLLERRLRPALQQLVEGVERDYLPHTRSSAGLGSLPQGEAWYRQRVREHTTTALTPDDIHTLGLREVARIQAALRQLQAQLGDARPLPEFLADLHWHPGLTPFQSEAEILAAYRVLNQRIEAQLPTLFQRRPRAPFEIRPEPEISRGTASDHYESPTAERPGVFYAVINNPKTYDASYMTSLLLHEGQPGHHFHAAFQQELDLPLFRRYGWITAYGEGWALYTETLGHEMGLYAHEPIALLGHLKMALHRAIRLVVDTGLHARGWSRDQTIAYMKAEEGATDEDARRSTERYMADPGQALGYMIGCLKIQALRERAQARLGPRFSLPEFHARVLGEGCLPLDLLEAHIDSWLQA